MGQVDDVEGTGRGGATTPRTLPGGHFTIDPEEDRRLAELVGGRSSADGSAHPIWAYIATQRGIGIELRDVFASVGFDMQAGGPMLGACELEFAAPLRTGVTYRVTGEIVGLEHKRGRRTGSFDLLWVRESLADPSGQRVASSLNGFVLPREDS